MMPDSLYDRIVYYFIPGHAGCTLLRYRMSDCLQRATVMLFRQIEITNSHDGSRKHCYSVSH